MQYIPIDFDEIYPGFWQRLRESGYSKDYNFEYPIPDDLQDDLIVAIGDYVRKRKGVTPSFSLYMDCKEEDEDGAISKGHVTGVGAGPYVYIELQDDDIESFSVSENFEPYSSRFLSENPEADNRRLDGFNSGKGCFEVGDYGQIITGFYLKVENNKSARMFLDVI